MKNKILSILLIATTFTFSSSTFAATKTNVKKVQTQKQRKHHNSTKIFRNKNKYENNAIEKIEKILKDNEPLLREFLEKNKIDNFEKLKNKYREIIKIVKTQYSKKIETLEKEKNKKEEIKKIQDIIDFLKKLETNEGKKPLVELSKLIETFPNVKKDIDAMLSKNKKGNKGKVVKKPKK